MLKFYMLMKILQTNVLVYLCTKSFWTNMLSDRYLFATQQHACDICCWFYYFRIFHKSYTQLRFISITVIIFIELSIKRIYIFPSGTLAHSKLRVRRKKANKPSYKTWTTWNRSTSNNMCIKFNRYWTCRRGNLWLGS